jgi:hypothetical protein
MGQTRGTGGLEPGSYLPPAPSRRIVAGSLRTGGPRHHIHVSNAVTARARSGSDVVPLSVTKSVETDHATSMRARARASWGFTGGAGDMTLASDQTLPGRRKGRLLCGAKTRAGGCCQVRAEPGKARCRFHGGKSKSVETDHATSMRARARASWRRHRCALRELARKTI